VKPALQAIFIALCFVLVFGLQRAGAQSSPVPEWQIAAGGSMSFDVASVRPTDTFTPPTFPLSADNSYRPTGGLLSPSFPLITYIQFAYKIFLTADQQKSLLSRLPNWVSTDRFAIQARAATENPTKDQMRLMMQSLLADRFKLAIHFEKQELPVFGLTLIKPGKPGPQLRPHSDGPPCDEAVPTPDAPKGNSVFPAGCDTFEGQIRADKKAVVGSRNNTMKLIAQTLPAAHNFGRPVVDQTGLSGTFDFTIEWAPEAGDAFAAAGTTSQTEIQGPTFLEALKDQLGLKIESTRAILDVPVIDHVEKLSEN
jgi:bla regulator protein BlaR1